MGGVGRHIRLHQISWVGRKGKAKRLTHEQARTRAEAESQSTVASDKADGPDWREGLVRMGRRDWTSGTG